MAFLLKLMRFVRFVDSWHSMTMKCGDWSFKRAHLIDVVYQNYTKCYRQTWFKSIQSAAMSIKMKQFRSMWSSNPKLVSLERIWWRYCLYSWAVHMGNVSLSIIHSNSKGRILIWIQFWRLCFDITSMIYDDVFEWHFSRIDQIFHVQSSFQSKMIHMWTTWNTCRVYSASK